MQLRLCTSFPKVQSLLRENGFSEEKSKNWAGEAKSMLRKSFLSDGGRYSTPFERILGKMS